MGAKCPIELVPNGVDLAKFPNNDQNSNIKSKLGLSVKDKVITTVSRLVKKNGVSDLIKAVKFLKNDTHLLILGTGELEEKLKLESIQNGVAKRVHFLGNIHHDDLPRYLQISDVFCRPSLSEGLGIAFLEAMAAGVPLVAPKVGGIPDFLKNEETGLFCEVNNPKDVAEKINTILNDQELKNKLSSNGTTLVRETYSWDLIANKIKNIFNDLCAS